MIGKEFRGNSHYLQSRNRVLENDNQKEKIDKRDDKKNNEIEKEKME